MTHVQPELPFGLEDLQRELDQIRRDNKQVYEDILRNKARPDANSVVGLRLEILLETLFGGPESHARLRFEIAYEERMATALKQMLEQARRAQLLAPPTPATGSNGASIILPPPGGAR